MRDDFDVAVIGAGAAGLAAGLRLAASHLSVVVVEARGRIGGRAHTVHPRPGLPIDLGCEWLHSADHNPLVARVAEAGFTVDRTPAAWEKQSDDHDFSRADQAAFGRAFDAFEERLSVAAARGEDRPGADFFEPGGRWNAAINAISAYYNGAEFDQVSTVDYAAYDDSGVNWRVREGYGAAIAALGGGLPVVLDCPVERIDHAATPIRLVTSKGTLSARAVIVAVPTDVLASGRPTFSPALPDKQAQAAALPLGLANKVFFGLERPEAVPVEGHLAGSTEHTDTASYYLRPLGRPLIECYFGGRHARALEAEGEGAATAFAREELTRLMGAGFVRELVPLVETRWASDPWAMGSYSHALPGRAAARLDYGRPVENRLFFAGEAASPHAFSTAHGAWESGVLAAEMAMAALG